MAYFKIGEIDFSPYCSELNITKTANFNAQMNASGNTVVDYINHKREIEVRIIPIDEEVMKDLMAAIAPFDVSISFLNPTTGLLEEEVECIIPDSKVEYYTIQTNKVMFKEFTLTFTEL